MQRSMMALMLLTSSAALVVPMQRAFAQAENKSWHVCQKTVGKEASRYVQDYIKLVGGCADSISRAVIEEGQPVAAAATQCKKACLGLVNTSEPEGTVAARFAAKVNGSCAQPLITDGAIRGIIGTVNLDAWCAKFDGDGSAPNLDAWVSCLTAAGTCSARETLATTYPRLLEWLNLVKPQIAALDPDCGGSCAGDCSNQEVIDACHGLEVVEAAIDGATDDDLPEIACGTPTGEVTASPLRTGQTTCYDGYGDAIACAGTGQDGDVQHGVTPLYAFDNSVPDERTVLDHRTGLEWEVLCDEDPEGVAATCPTVHDVDTLYPTWSSAFAKIAAMNASHYGGHDDWRLPNLRELQTLVKYAVVHPAIETSYFHTSCQAPCSAKRCSCTREGFYWSSTTHNFRDHGAPVKTGAWAVDFAEGLMSSGLANEEGNRTFVRAVRSKF